MSTVSVIQPMPVPLIGRQVRAYFAPVNRSNETPTIFDPSQNSFKPGTAPASPWVDLGWLTDFARTSETTIAEISAGIPSIPITQAFTKMGASVSLSFSTWSKLGMALATASQHMNVLAAATSSAAIASGAKAYAAVPLQAGSSATTIYLAAQPAVGITTGDIVVVDSDYAQQTGYVGAPFIGGYVTSAAAVGADPDYVRRVSFNVGRVVSIRTDGGLELAAPLIAGTPAVGMKLQQVTGFVDREGGNFIPEWSAVFAMQGSQGDMLYLYYPRLQVMEGAREEFTQLASGISLVQPAAKFRALPVTDGNDGAASLCYRTYIPASFAAI